VTKKADEAASEPVSDPVSEPVSDRVVGRSQQEWRRARAYLNQHRYELGHAAARLYPRSWPVAGTNLLARPSWLPDAPVPLEQVTLSWTPGWPARPVDGTEPESAAARPLRDGAGRFGCYAAALGALNRPGIFEDRACYRLLEASAAPGTASLGFGEGRYFEVINVGEAVAHEYAAAVLASGDPARPPRLDDLPLRALIGDPTDLGRRGVMTAVCTLVLRAGAGADAGASMILHWRDPARVASGGGLYQVVPVGIFQPSHDAEWNQANDFSLWRCIVRELAEELLGADEDYHSDVAPIDYERWPLQAGLAQARRAGRLRLSWLGLGVDPLTLTADLLTVAVFEPDLFDATFSGLVPANDEGRILVTDDAPGPGGGWAFNKKNVERYAGAEPMQPAGAALLRLAWQHCDTLLAG
jgi:hypothetical protein